MQSCHAAAGLLDAWQGGVHWCQKRCVNWGSCSSVASRGKTGKRKRGKLVAKKLFWLTLKWSVISSLPKLPVCGWAIVLRTEKIVFLQLTTVKSLNLMHEWNKPLGACSPIGRQHPKEISHEISLVICSFITLNLQTLMCKGKIPSYFWDGPTTSNLLLWPSKQRTCTGILGKRAKFFPMQSSIQHLSKTQLTSSPGPPDLTEGTGKDKMGKPKTCISVAARGILSTLVTAKGTLHPSKTISSRANHTPAGGTCCAVNH